MSHPAELLKKYIIDLSEQITSSDAKSEDNIRIMNGNIDKLGVKVDGNIQKTDEAIERLDLKLDTDNQVTGDVVKNLGSKIDSDIAAIKESINALNRKLDSSVQTTNQAIGDLYREKLSVREFREFVDAFSEILTEDMPLTKQSSREPKPDILGDNGTTSSSQLEIQVIPPSVIDSNPSKSEEETPSAVETGKREVFDQHVGFPMKVAGDYYYVGDGVTSVVGDVEIPPGTIVDDTLVIKGNFRSCESCMLRSNVKALKNIEIGNDTTVEGTLVSGGKVTILPNCFVRGAIESRGNVEIGDNVVVTEKISCKSSVILSKSAQIYHPIHAAKGVLRH